MFNTLKKLVGKKEDSPSSSSPSSSSSSSPSTTSTTSNNMPKLSTESYHAGIYNHSTCIHYDPIQKLVAVAFNNGQVKIFGQDGMETQFQLESSPILKIIFLYNTPHIMVITPHSIEKWDYNDGVQITQLNYKNRITSIAFLYGCNFMYIGDESGYISTYNVFSHFLSSYKIFVKEEIIKAFNVPSTDDQQQIFSSAIDICPSDHNLLLIGCNNGTLVSWNLESRRLEKKLSFKTYVTKVCWSRKGNKFICGFFDGQILFVDYQKQSPSLVFKPQFLQQQQQQQERVSIDQLELLYTKDKKIIMFRGYYQGSNSLVIIRGDNYKDVSKLGVTLLAPSVFNFTSISTTPYPSSRDLSSVIALTSTNQLLYCKLDTSPLQQLKQIDDICLKKWIENNNNNQNNNNSDNNPNIDLILMKTYECDQSTKQKIIEALKIYQKPTTSIGYLESPVSGGLIKDNRSTMQLMITYHKDQSLRFWDYTDARNYQFLGKSTDILPNLITFSFCVTTFILAASYSAGLVHVYQLDNGSRRIEKSFFKIQKEAEIPKQQSPTSVEQAPQQQSPTSVEQAPEQLPSPTPQPTEQQSSPSSSSPPPQQDNNNNNLPDPSWSGLQLMGEIKLDCNMNVICLNPWKKKTTTRLVMGGSQGNVHHFMIVVSDNSCDGVSTSRTVYRAAIDYRGSVSAPSYEGASQGNDITTMELCFYSLRENDDISLVHAGTQNGSILVIDVPSMSIITSFKASSHPIKSVHYADKNGNQLRYLFLDMLDNFISSLPNTIQPPVQSNDENNNNNNSTTEIAPLTNVVSKLNIKLDDIHLIVSSGNQIIKYTIPSQSLSQYTPTPKSPSTTEAPTTPTTTTTTTNNNNFNHPKERCEEFKNHQVISTSFLRDTSSDKQYLSVIDQSGQLTLFDCANHSKHGLEKRGHYQLPNHNIKCLQALVSVIGGVMVVSQNSMFSVCLQPAIFRTRYQFFVDGINIPPEPKSAVSSGISSFFFAKAPVNLDTVFSEGIKLPQQQSNHGRSQQSNNQKVFVEDIAGSLNETMQKLNERGEKIDELSLKTQQMESASRDFASMTKQLAANNKSWF
ncbi:hypothetical protein DFA_02745 [Cavenderia fasciculata]|uniref:V-SNARE coiled-coil homology domain-containing protein n=1 Tax=Cavenderia fasciculata TaxID=261658 RepID=F4PI15_CACFS|nr:uncharacterized protein DFA_02745 [Cavenderia fasciculata]EGG24502.1 hypothetical protein DFA_02745 [Cavenderia fasciculata]|eukprot:XP_004362353.1 hypothetical protein DFA_02745 [Cavenderia fasciculata]